MSIVKPVHITRPVDVSAKVLRLSFKPIRFLDQLLDGNAVSTLRENRGNERPRRDNHVSLVMSNHVEHEVMDQQRLGFVQAVYVPKQHT